MNLDFPFILSVGPRGEVEEYMSLQFPLALRLRGLTAMLGANESGKLARSF
jgi:hypothetical protein